MPPLVGFSVNSITSFELIEFVDEIHISVVISYGFWTGHFNAGTITLSAVNFSNILRMMVVR